MRTRAIMLPLLLLASRPVLARLEPNAPGAPIELNTTGAVPCAGRNLCSVLLDVPAACVKNGASTCPVGFFFHGHGGTNREFATLSNPRFGGATKGVHDHGFIGVYPQGALYGGFNPLQPGYNKTAARSGWNDGSMPGNKCEWDDFACQEDPNDGTFTAGIIDGLRK